MRDPFSGWRPNHQMMGSDEASPVLDCVARSVRFGLRFVELNWLRLAENALAIVSWVAILVVVFARFGGPRWLFNVLLVGGIVAYTVTRKPFVLPPDD